MTNAKPNNVFAERDALQRENERLKQENETLKYRLQVVGDIAGENNLLRCRAEAELEAARKVADAAVAAEDARFAIIRRRVSRAEVLTVSIFEELVKTNTAAQAALDDAVREYRREYRARAESNGKENGE